MSQGTRCHQVAMYVVYESPLQMLCETPSAYYQEEETVSFIAQIQQPGMRRLSWKDKSVTILW